MHVSHLLDGASDRNPTSITACPSDPNKFAVSFTTGEVGIFALVPSCGVKMLALLPAFEGHPGASKPTFSLHDEKLAWVNSLGQLLTNDLKSTKVKPFPTQFPLSSSAYHPTCRALISTTPEGGLVAHSVCRLERPLWRFPMPANSPAAPIRFIAFKPIPICATASWADPFISQGVFSVSDGQPTPTVNPPQLASSLRSPRRKTNDVEPSFIECFSSVKRPRVVPKDNRAAFDFSNAVKCMVAEGSNQGGMSSLVYFNSSESHSGAIDGSQESQRSQAEGSNLHSTISRLPAEAINANSSCILKGETQEVDDIPTNSGLTASDDCIDRVMVDVIATVEAIRNFPLANKFQTKFEGLCEEFLGEHLVMMRALCTQVAKEMAEMKAAIKYYTQKAATILRLKVKIRSLEREIYNLYNEKN
ncbi:hypothetical protein L0F63_001129, partial [Massospora cicadina]